MSAYKRIKVIINPAAGTSEPVLSILDEVFGPAGIDWDVAITHKAGDGVSAAHEAITQGFDLIGVYGGDGTVAEVASALADGGPPLLLLPGGTGNALADDLGIPTALAEAAALGIDDTAEVRRIDMGRAGERTFVLRLTMGVEAEMVGSTTRDMKDRFGWLAYVISGVQALSSPQPAAYTITIDGERHEAEGVALMVANSAAVGHIAGARIAQDVDVSDGQLDVVLVETAALPSLLGTVADAVRGNEPTGLSHWSGRRIRVEAEPALAVLADGEDSGLTPIDVEVLPGAVSVLVPASTAEAGA